MRLAWLAMLVPVFALGELGAHVYFAKRAPSPEEWEAARPDALRLFQKGDPVVVAPHWAEPLARWKWGDELFPLREVARPELARYAKALEVDLLGERDPELRDWPVEHEQRSGKLILRSVRNPAPPQIAFDFTDHVSLPFAEAHIEQPSGPVACPFTENAPVETLGLFGPSAFPARRFRCALDNNAGYFVGVTLLDDERELPRRCIWIHPPPAGETVLRFAKVPLGSVIHGHTGIGWMIERDRVNGPVSLRVLVNDEPVGTVVHHHGEGWSRFELPLGAAAHTEATVEFRSRAEPNAGAQLCFEADSR